MRCLASISIVAMLLCPAAALAFVPAGFIENRGQMNEAVRYYAPGSGVSVYFTREAIVLDLKGIGGNEDGMARRGSAVWIRIEGAERSARIEARGRLITETNYFLGSDPRGWRTGVPAFEEVAYVGLRSGIMCPS